jgi:hypothetical protein
MILLQCTVGLKIKSICLVNTQVTSQLTGRVYCTSKFLEGLRQLLPPRISSQITEKEKNENQKQVQNRQKCYNKSPKFRSITHHSCSGSWEPVSRYRANEVHLEVRNLGGSGFWNEGANEQKTGEWGVQFTSKRRPRWTDPVTARRVPSKWKREQGEQGE